MVSIKPSSKDGESHQYLGLTYKSSLGRKLAAHFIADSPSGCDNGETERTGGPYTLLVPWLFKDELPYH